MHQLVGGRRYGVRWGPGSMGQAGLHGSGRGEACRLAPACRRASRHERCFAPTTPDRGARPRDCGGLSLEPAPANIYFERQRRCGFPTNVDRMSASIRARHAVPLPAPGTTARGALSSGMCRGEACFAPTRSGTGPLLWGVSLRLCERRQGHGMPWNSVRNTTRRVCPRIGPGLDSSRQDHTPANPSHLPSNRPPGGAMAAMATRESPPLEGM